MLVVVIGVGGMGIAVARRLGAGRRLLLADFDSEALSGAEAQLREEGHDAVSEEVDVSSPEAVSRLAAAAAASGPVVQVVHTAGLSPVQASTEAILHVDLLGVALVLEAFGGVIAGGGAGAVISSMAAHLVPDLPVEQRAALLSTPASELLALPFLDPRAVGDPGAAYSLAKRANQLAVQKAAVEWGRRGARLNSVSPGVISTAMGRQELAGEHGEHMRALIGMSPAGRLGTPEDIASAVAFLVGPDSSFITGTDLLVDGGSVAALRCLAP